MQSPSVPEQASCCPLDSHGIAPQSLTSSSARADLERFCCSGFRDLSWSLPFVWQTPGTLEIGLLPTQVFHTVVPPGIQNHLLYLAKESWVSCILYLSTWPPHQRRQNRFEYQNICYREGCVVILQTELTSTAHDSLTNQSRNGS